MQLSVNDLIELAETGKVRNIVLDSTAKIVLHECLNMLEFEADYYERGGRNGMQDRFKFRAWSDKKKRYIYNVQNCSNYCYKCFKCWVLMDGADIVRLEQCTGLKDKNGKLIYEGDIVEVPVLYNGIPTGQKQRCKVYYKHGAFNIYAVKSEYLKIVGNIHENSELLEG